jgi:hypothetical protein
MVGKWLSSSRAIERCPNQPMAQKTWAELCQSLRGVKGELGVEFVGKILDDYFKDMEQEQSRSQDSAKKVRWEGVSLC